MFLFFFKNEKKKDPHTPPKTSCQAPSARVLARTLNQNKFSLFFSSYNKGRIFFFSCCLFFLYIWWFFGAPTHVFSWIHCSCWPTTDKVILCAACSTRYSHLWMDGIVSKERKCFLPIWTFFFYVVRTTTEHAVVYYSRPCYLTL